LEHQKTTFSARQLDSRVHYHVQQLAQIQRAAELRTNFVERRQSLLLSCRHFLIIHKFSLASPGLSRSSPLSSESNHNGPVRHTPGLVALVRGTLHARDE